MNSVKFFQTDSVENLSKGDKLEMELVEEYNITDLLPEELYELS
jgi:hypothetical protein